MKRKRVFLAAALAPGWLIPRLVGTAAFLAHPSAGGLAALLTWWLAIPIFWLVMSWYLRQRRRGS
jgi:hypothetical protein